MRWLRSGPRSKVILMPDNTPTEQGERVGITEFHFQVCSRCGHPPSDGPCIMGNAEHAETWETPYASFGVVHDLSSALQAEREKMLRLAEDWESRAESIFEPRIERALRFCADALRSIIEEER